MSADTKNVVPKIPSSAFVSVSLIGHWAVGHVAHKRGHQTWMIEGLPVQGYNLPRLGFITFGESWHGNHHAFPHSAKLGIERHQSDVGFVFIKALEHIGLASNIKGPESESPRDGLVKIDSDNNKKPSDYKARLRSTHYESFILS